MKLLSRSRVPASLVNTPEAVAEGIKNLLLDQPFYSGFARKRVRENFVPGRTTSTNC